MTATNVKAASAATPTATKATHPKVVSNDHNTGLVKTSMDARDQRELNDMAEAGVSTYAAFLGLWSFSCRTADQWDAAMAAIEARAAQRKTDWQEKRQALRDLSLARRRALFALWQADIRNPGQWHYGVEGATKSSLGWLANRGFVSVSTQNTGYGVARSGRRRSAYHHHSKFYRINVLSADMMHVQLLPVITEPHLPVPLTPKFAQLVDEVLAADYVPDIEIDPAGYATYRVKWNASDEQYPAWLLMRHLCAAIRNAWSRSVIDAARVEMAPRRRPPMPTREDEEQRRYYFALPDDERKRRRNRDDLYLYYDGGTIGA